MVDKEPDRLALAERFGAAAVNLADADPTELIMDGTDGFGVDCGVEAVGYQAHDPTGQEHPEMVLDKLVEVVRQPRLWSPVAPSMSSRRMSMWPAWRAVSSIM
ncbi:MAG: hypothetical protein ACRDRF_20755 [Pseudonocardiaceae bacterium]